MNINVENLRNEYKGEFLDVSNVNASPFIQFEKWFQQAVDSEIADPNAMIASTADTIGMPSIRTVLLKAWDTDGFVFYTNYKSKKAIELTGNPKIALLFPWFPLSRQLIIRGEAEKVSKLESIKYFISRPFGSKLGAWVSHQSQIVSSRSILEMKLREMKEKFKKGEVPLPDDWGGYRVRPVFFEFWQGQPNRLHDRIVYTLQKDETWRIERIAP
jgi:pyridoxamine 5'-phosphate oxidase